MTDEERINAIQRRLAAMPFSAERECPEIEEDGGDWSLGFRSTMANGEPDFYDIGRLREKDMAIFLAHAGDDIRFLIAEIRRLRSQWEDAYPALPLWFRQRYYDDLTPDGEVKEVRP